VGNLPSLSSTLDRIDRLLQEKQADRDKELDVDDLAFRTALPKSTVQALLNREPAPQDELEQRVCARIAAVGTAYLDTTGKRAADVRREIAAAVGRSPEWARLLLAGQSMPTVPNFVAVREYLQRGLPFEIDEKFFTAPADEALSRALQPVVERLGGHDPLEAVLAELQVRSVDHRAADMSTRQRVALAEFIRAVVTPDEAER
jgi:hypothetical protein